MENLQTQGISLPRLGLGTYRMQGDACRAAVENALGLGYRHIDTAEMYGNEDAIGVANFNIALLKTVVEQIKAPIACNQIEYHVMLDQTPVRRYMSAKSIPLVAYCPLAQGRAASDETLTAIGSKHGASAAQVALKWLLDQDDVAAIPKASRSESQQANLDALNVGLDDEDMKAIAALPKNRRCVNPGFAPAWD